MSRQGLSLPTTTNDEGGTPFTQRSPASLRPGLEISSAPIIILSPAAEIYRRYPVEGEQGYFEGTPFDHTATVQIDQDDQPIIHRADTSQYPFPWTGRSSSSSRTPGASYSRQCSVTTQASDTTEGDDSEDRPLTPEPWAEEGLDQFYTPADEEREGGYLRQKSFPGLYLDRADSSEVLKGSALRTVPIQIVSSATADGSLEQLAELSTPSLAHRLVPSPPFSSSPRGLARNSLGLSLSPSPSPIDTPSPGTNALDPSPSARIYGIRPSRQKSSRQSRGLWGILSRSQEPSGSKRVNSSLAPHRFPWWSAMSLPTISVSPTAVGSRMETMQPRRRRFIPSRRNWKRYLVILLIFGVTAYLVMGMEGGSQSASGAGTRYQRMGNGVGAGAGQAVERKLDARMNVRPNERLEIVAPVEDPAGKASGISFLELEEDELIAEDDLYYDSLPTMPKDHRQTKVAGTRGIAKTFAEQNTALRLQAITSLEDRLVQPVVEGRGEDEPDEEALQKLIAIEAHTRSSSLMALVHFLQHGGEVPMSWLQTAEGEEHTTELEQIMRGVWKHGGGDGMEHILSTLAIALPANAAAGADEDDAALGKRDDEPLDELAERLRAKLGGDLRRDQRSRQKPNAGKKQAGAEHTPQTGRAFPLGWRKNQALASRLVIFSKSYCPYSKRAKETIAKYKPVPAPYIVELDKRSDGPVLQSLLHALTSRRTVPNILLNYEPLGGSDEIMLLDAEGGLRKVLVGAGMRMRNTKG